MVEDPSLEVPQRPTGLDPQLLPEGAAAVCDRPERLGLPARAVEGQGELGAQLLAQRVGLDQRGELADHRRVAPERELGRQPVLGGRDPPLLHPEGKAPHLLHLDELGQYRPTPQRLGLEEDVARGHRVPAVEEAATSEHQLLEPPGVDRLTLDGEAVAAVGVRERHPRGVVEPAP